MPIKSRTELKVKFKNGTIPFQEDFWDIIDTLVSQSEDGISIVKNTDGTFSLGLGVTKNVAAPLSIKRTGEKQALISFHDEKEGPLWGFATLNVKDAPGFNLLQVIENAAVSRLFVDSRTGQVGMGTELPKAQLQVEANKTNAGAGIKIRNTASAAAQPGWFFLHLNDNSSKTRNGAFVISDSLSSGTEGSERLIIMPNSGYVGINEKEPDTFLHVSRPDSNADSLIDLRYGTGIAQFGTITQSVLFDYQGVQSRRGRYLSNKIKFEPSVLHFQRLGGDTLFHGANNTAEEQKVIIKTDGSIGVGVLAPAEKLHVSGRIILSDSEAEPIEGTMRWSGTDFEGFDGTNWVSMTGGNAGMWSAAGTNKITYNVANANVGIGVAVPSSALHVANATEVEAGSTAVRILNTAATTGTQQSDTRIALDVSTSGIWSATNTAKSIALLTTAGGAGKSNANLAAVLNGNVSIGPVSNSQEMIGNNGQNVLVIQNGVSPTAQVGGAGVNNGGIQIYSESNASGISLFTLRNGDGKKVQLYQAAALTISATNTVDATYGDAEATVINNLRTRLDELEARLKAFGLLATANPPLIPSDPNA